MQTKSPPPPDKDTDVDFSGEQKDSQSLLQPGWQLSRKKESTATLAITSYQRQGTNLTMAEEMLS